MHVTSNLLAVSWKVYSERLAHPGRYSRGFASQIRRPVSMSTIDATVDARALQGGNAPSVDERRADRIYCPAPGCPRSYSQFRSEKRHSVLDHHMRYNNRTRSLVEFESQEAFQIAYAKCKEAQKSGQKRRAEENTGESPPLRSMPPEQRQEMGRPGIGTQPTSAGTSAQDTREVTWREAGDKESRTT